MSVSLEIHYSGGTSNSDPDVSLGGVMSSVAVSDETAVRQTSNLTGVTINDSHGCGKGVATLHMNILLDTLAFKKPGGVDVADIDYIAIPSADDYEILCPEGDASISVTANPALFPSSGATYQSDLVDITVNSEQVFRDITQEQALSGVTQYRCLYLKNLTAATITVTPYIASNADGADSVYIGHAYTTSGTEEETIASETTAPSSVSAWSLAPNPSSGTTLTITAGDEIGIWLKRVVPPVTTEPVAYDSVLLGFEIS